MINDGYYVSLLKGETRLVETVGFQVSANALGIGLADMAIIAEKTEKTQPEQLTLFEPSRWPRRPYCTNDLSAGLRIRSLRQALEHRYIQANPPHLRVWSIHDCDYEGAGIAWELAELPPPSWVAINRENAHAHLVYGLSAPVLVDHLSARDAPMRYLAAIESAMREVLRADAGYSGLITKNPKHPDWKLYRGPRLGYELSELAESLEWIGVDIRKHRPNTAKAAEQAGLGRNCCLFDRLRHWAYVAVRAYRAERKAGQIEAWNRWMSACNTRALEYNGDFRYPLDGREVWWVARSVAKWVWQRDAQAERDFRARQASKGRKGGLAKGLANEDRRASARLMRASGQSYQQIADALGVSRRTVIYWCK